MVADQLIAAVYDRILFHGSLNPDESVQAESMARTAFFFMAEPRNL